MASGGTSHALKAVGERAGRRDGANVACYGTGSVLRGRLNRVELLPGRIRCVWGLG
jgi:hypothetical protein